MKSLVSIAVLLLPIAALASAAPDWPKALVTVHTEEPRGAIPADFLGLSYEKPDMAQSHFRRGNTVMANLFRNLGAGVLRMGGTSVDLTYWRQTPAKPVSKKHAGAIEPSALESSYGFVQECGWRVIHGLNLGANDPAMAADEAAYAMRVGGQSVLALEFGNEPNIFAEKGIRRESGYDYAQYHREVEAYYRAIFARLPGAPMAGPATTQKGDWFANFVRDFQGRIVLATSHCYPLSARQTDPRKETYASVENLLKAATELRPMPMIEDHVKAARAAGIPFRLTECNSASGGGKEGVSDVFASALWGVDFLFDLADRGVAGINLHSRFDKCEGYTPFCWLGDHYHVHPIYYSMLLFHQAMRGRTVPVECQSPVNVTAHAVLGDDHRLRVALINKDPAHGVSVSIAAGARRGEAGVIRLAAPSVMSKDGVTLGGSAVHQDGTWTPQGGEPVRCVNGRFDVPLPAASAALLTIE